MSQRRGRLDPEPRSRLRKDLCRAAFSFQREGPVGTPRALPWAKPCPARCSFYARVARRRAEAWGRGWDLTGGGTRALACFPQWAGSRGPVGWWGGPGPRGGAGVGSGAPLTRWPHPSVSASVGQWVGGGARESALLTAQRPEWCCRFGSGDPTSGLHRSLRSGI